MSSMASTFPAAIANEPPPLDISSEDEDSEEYRSHGLKLDVPSGEPTPVTTPYKRPLNKSPDKIKHVEYERADEELIVSVSPESSQSSSEEASIDPIGVDSSHIADKQVNGIDHSVDKVEGESIENEDDWHDAPLQEDLPEQEVEKATDYCDSGTNVNCTNSNISQEWESNPNDNELQTENAVLDSVQLCDDEENEDGVVDEVSDATEPSRNEESSIEDADTDTFGDQSPEENTASPLDKPVDESSEEFLDFQVSDKDTSNSNQQTVESDVQNHVDSDALDKTDEITANVELNQDDDFDDDDFGAFQSIPQPSTQQQSQPLVENTEEDNDDFGDFAQTSVQTTSTRSVPSATNQLTAQTSQDAIEEFADFQDCSFQSSDGSSSVKPSFATSIPITSKIDSIIKSLFVIDPNSCDDEASKPNSIDSEISVSSDSTWARVQDFEGSHALMFKWLGSLTGKRLLRSLNINTTNIVYHEKWGSIEVPKFAASLVQSPLQPQSCNKFEQQSKSDEHPAIVNNNTILSDDHDKPTSISSEAQEILRQLPDLSYMRANTLVFPQSSPSGL